MGLIGDNYIDRSYCVQRLDKECVLANEPQNVPVNRVRLGRYLNRAPSADRANLPEHFDDPQFRADALRVISGSLAKIDGMCGRLAMLRQKIELSVAECDLNHLIATTLDEFKSNLRAELEQELQPVPK